MKKFLIYALHHDSSQHVYVGKSSQGLNRPREHGKNYNLKKFAHLPVCRWITKLRSNGHDYSFSILELCDSTLSLAEAERFYIELYRSIGMKLLNLTDGGEGTLGIKKSPEEIERMRTRNLGRKASVETKLKMSISHKTPEAITHRGLVNSRRIWTNESRRKVGDAVRGRRFSEEHRRKIGEANKRRVWTAESKEKISSWRSNFKQPREAIEKTASANRGKKRVAIKRLPGPRINLFSGLVP